MCRMPAHGDLRRLCQLRGAASIRTRRGRHLGILRRNETSLARSVRGARQSRGVAALRCAITITGTPDRGQLFLTSDTAVNPWEIRLNRAEVFGNVKLE